MWRRKARTFLTVLGIVVGIFALTVLGGLSARLTQQVNGAKSWFTNHITVNPQGGALFGSQGKFLDLGTADRINRVPGVAEAVPGLGIMISDTQSVSFGAPELVIGLGLSPGHAFFKGLSLASGRYLQPGDTGKVMLGSILASKYNARVGGTVTLRGRPFEVTGILQPTLSAPDSFAFASYADASVLFHQANPFIQQDRNVASAFYVDQAPGVNPETLANAIQKSLTGVKVVSPKEAEKQIAQFSLIFNAILFGSALIALIVGGLSIINTMVMSVSERKREIGLKKAIGAQTNAILGEYLLESSVIGLIGGLIGMCFGVALIAGLNKAGSVSNVRAFAVTPLVVFGPIVFAIILGALAGLFPALRAARLKPVDSLKED